MPALKLRSDEEVLVSRGEIETRSITGRYVALFVDAEPVRDAAPLIPCQSEFSTHKPIMPDLSRRSLTPVGASPGLVAGVRLADSRQYGFVSLAVPNPFQLVDKSV